MALSIDRPKSLDDTQRSAVRALISSVAGLDGRNPLSDQALTKLGAATVEHAIAADSEQVVGYAQLDGKSLEIAARDSAVGALLDAFAGRDLLVWTHGEHSRLVAPLDARGYRRQRELFQLRRSLTDRPEPPAPPDEVEIRPFAVGSDEDAWVAVNAAAFASHPEQGSWTRADLEAREAEEWFDPSGFLMAWRGNDLVGFHWTKMHPDGAGEVYVLAVAPQAQGLHLGSVLLLHGLAALYDAGAREVLLYVDGDNTAAVRLYERTGFTRQDLDVQWRAPALQSAETGTVSNT
jgi:mycothiol synthase